LVCSDVREVSACLGLSEFTRDVFFFPPVDALIRIGRIVFNLAWISQARYLHARYVGCVGTVKSSLSSCHRAKMAKMTVGTGCCRRRRGRCIHRKPRLLIQIIREDRKRPRSNRARRWTKRPRFSPLRTSDPNHSRTDACAFALARSLPQAGYEARSRSITHHFTLLPIFRGGRNSAGSRCNL